MFVDLVLTGVCFYLLRPLVKNIILDCHIEGHLEHLNGTHRHERDGSKAQHPYTTVEEHHQKSIDRGPYDGKHDTIRGYEGRRVVNIMYGSLHGRG
jgi:hypothetical protein